MYYQEREVKKKRNSVINQMFKKRKAAQENPNVQNKTLIQIPEEMVGKSVPVSDENSVSEKPTPAQTSDKEIPVPYKQSGAETPTASAETPKAVAVQGKKSPTEKLSISTETP